MKQHHSIWTPELVELSLPLAGITRRVLARMVDQIILVAAMCVGVIGLLFAVGAMHLEPAAAFIAGLVMLVLADFFYYWGFHALAGGQTPGKMLMRIRVVTARGGRINGVTALIRSLFNFADTLLFGGSVSAIMIVATDDEKRIADYASGTIVVVEG